MTLSLKALRDDALTIASDFETVQASVVDAIRAGDPSDADLRHLGAELHGLEIRVKELRTTLDTTDVANETVYSDGAVLIGLWKWERALRRDLVRFQGGLRAMIEMTETLERGDESQVYVSRAGQTLQGIAQETLGDWREWPRLLTANPGLGPGELPSGTVLTIPKTR